MKGRMKWYNVGVANWSSPFLIGLAMSVVGCPLAFGGDDARSSPVETGFEIPSIVEAIPEITQEELVFLRAQRPRFEAVNAAWRLKGEGKPDEALNAARSAVEADPGFGPAIDAYVEIGVQTDRRNEVEARFQSRKERQPDDWIGWYGLAGVRSSEGKWEDALAGGQRTIAEDCPFWGCYSVLASSFQKLKQTDEGVRFFRSLAEKEEDGPQRNGLAWLGLGDLLDDDLARRKEVEEALTNAVRSLRPGLGMAKSQNCLGMLFEETSRAREALDAYGMACALEREMGNRRREGIILGNIGVVYADLGEMERGLGYFDRALTIHREMGDRVSEGRALGSIGTAYIHLGRLEKTIEIYEQALKVQREVKSRADEGVLLGNLGYVYTILGESGRATELYEKARELHREAGNRQAEGCVLANLGNLYTNLGEIGKATERYGQAIELLQLTGARNFEAVVLGALGAVYKIQGENGKAIESFEQALEVHREVKNRAGEGNVLGNLGVVYTELGEIERGIEYYEQALKVHREVGYLVGEGYVLGNLGIAYKKLGKPEESMKYYEQALKVHREVGNKRSEATVLAYLGDVNREAGELAKSIEYYESARAMFREVGDTRFEGSVSIALGTSYRESGQLDKGIEFQQRALALHRSTGSKDGEFDALTALASTLGAQGHRSEALLLTEDALVLVPELISATGDPDLEASYFTSLASIYPLNIRLLSSELPNDPAPLLSPEMITRTFDLAETARARSFHRSLQLARLDTTQGIPAQITRNFHEARQRLEQARTFQKAENMSPAERHAIQSYLDDKLAPYLERTDLTRIPLPDAARTLLRQQQNIEADTLGPEERDALLEDILRVRERYYHDAEQALRETSPAYKQLQEPRLVTLNEVQEALDGRTLLLAYLLGKKESFAWAITRQQARLLHLPKEETLNAQVEALRDQLQNREGVESDALAPAHGLYQTLLAPAADLMESGAHLVIIPDGILGSIPFEALVSKAYDAHDPHPDYIGFTHAITYASSATVWWKGQRLPAFKPADGPLLAVLDPLYLSNDDCPEEGLQIASLRAGSRADRFDEPWLRLCYAREEARRIQRQRSLGQFPRRHDVFLEGANASESQFRDQDLARFSILHFAAHAKAWPDVPGRSAVILSQHLPEQEDTLAADRQEDGYLDLRDIVELELNADLVVLSACESAVGRTRKGEGVESLARGFLMAGAKKVVASQWKVADEATAEFMGRFYKSLKKRTIADALLETRKAFIESSDKPSRHPFFWAPFVLISGGGKLERCSPPCIP